MLWIIALVAVLYFLKAVYFLEAPIPWRKLAFPGILFIIAFFGVFYVSHFCGDFEKKHEYELVSIRSQQEISGNAGGFIFLTVSINTEDTLIYYYKSNGGFKKGKIKSQGKNIDLTIYETNERTPCLQVYRKSLYGIPYFLAFFSMDPTYIYKFYVPKGSIVQAFSLE